jgi:bacteriocin-like protein
MGHSLAKKQTFSRKFCQKTAQVEGRRVTQMEDLKKQESTDLTELTDKQLDKVSGGDLPIGGVQIEGIRGESLDDKHKEEIHVM